MYINDYGFLIAPLKIKWIIVSDSHFDSFENWLWINGWNSISSFSTNGG